MIDLDDCFRDFPEEEMIKQIEKFFDKLGQEYPCDVDLDKLVFEKFIDFENSEK